MWPLSLESSTRIYDLANLGLIVSLVGGVISTVVIVWMGNIKEAHWDKERHESRERVAELGKETAEANKRAKEAELALEKFRAPRKFDPDRRAQFIETLKPFARTAYDVSTYGPDSVEFALHIAEVLKDAAWDLRNWTGGGSTTILPAANRYAGNVVLFGVDIRGYNPKLTEAVNVLVKVLKDAGFDEIRGDIREPALTSEANMIHIMIGPKR